MLDSSLLSVPSSRDALHHRSSYKSSCVNLSRRASVALVPTGVTHQDPLTRVSVRRSKLTAEPLLLLPPAMQSCLRNTPRLSLPIPLSLPLPYPSPSIVFPSAEEGKALVSKYRAEAEWRRASDPDVQSEYEVELFKWVENEARASLNPSRLRKQEGLVRHRTAWIPSFEEIDADGYGADVEASPCLDRLHRKGSQIHTRNQSNTQARQRGRRLGFRPYWGSEREEHVGPRGSPPLVKAPRFDLCSENIPRFGSPTLEASPKSEVFPTFQGQGLGTPQIVLPNATPAMERQGSRPRGITISSGTPYKWAFEFQNRAEGATPGSEFASRFRDTDGNIRPRANSDPADSPSLKSPVSPPPTRPLPAVPKAAELPVKSKFEARKPQGLFLENLPKSSVWAPLEIKVNGVGLEGRNMQAPAVIDPRVKPKPKDVEEGGIMSPGEWLKSPRQVSFPQESAQPAKAEVKRRSNVERSRKTKSTGDVIKSYGPTGLGLEADIGTQLGLGGLNAPLHEVVTKADQTLSPEASEKRRKHRSLPARVLSGSFFGQFISKQKEKNRDRKKFDTPSAKVEAFARVEADAKPSENEAAPLLLDLAEMSKESREATARWVVETFRATDHGKLADEKIALPPSASLGGLECEVAFAETPIPESPLVQGDQSVKIPIKYVGPIHAPLSGDSKDGVDPKLQDLQVLLDQRSPLQNHISKASPQEDHAVASLVLSPERCVEVVPGDVCGGRAELMDRCASIHDAASIRSVVVSLASGSTEGSKAPLFAASPGSPSPSRFPVRSSSLVIGGRRRRDADAQPQELVKSPILGRTALASRANRGGERVVGGEAITDRSKQAVVDRSRRGDEDDGDRKGGGSPKIPTSPPYQPIRPADRQLRRNQGRRKRPSSSRLGTPTGMHPLRFAYNAQDSGDSQKENDSDEEGKEDVKAPLLVQSVEQEEVKPANDGRRKVRDNRTTTLGASSNKSPLLIELQRSNSVSSNGSVAMVREISKSSFGSFIKGEKALMSPISNRNSSPKLEGGSGWGGGGIDSSSQSFHPGSGSEKVLPPIPSSFPSPSFPNRLDLLPSHCYPTLTPSMILGSEISTCLDETSPNEQDLLLFLSPPNRHGSPFSPKGEEEKENLIQSRIGNPSSSSSSSSSLYTSDWAGTTAVGEEDPFPPPSSSSPLPFPVAF
ncbi:hypothetical protein IE53DRAFT_388207 [Violaceomyces palustris]|uniref:Uncharacterized protein n=1 Tax=Violaceomyces palustris TaxID=1673888 RepID=A0ACD0NUS1_9BASI|nr:hypothetical protein IE53DRAFT_388207 [Violaceomyces palustris]